MRSQTFNILRPNNPAYTFAAPVIAVKIADTTKLVTLTGAGAK